jgi:Kef-type K+ transport system membrane component KefB
MLCAVSAAEFDRLLLLLTVQIGVIIGLARLLGTLVQRVRQPQVIGEIIAGIVLGPSLLGWVAPGVANALFPDGSLRYLKVLSEFGIVFFMFLIGLELNAALLRQHGRAAAVVSATSIALPFALGASIALMLYDSIGGPGVTRVGFAVFLGAAMAITAFPVLARILSECDLLRSRVGTMALTCAAVDDIAGWCLLSVVAAVGHARGALDSLATLALVLLYLGAMFAFVRPLLRVLLTRYERRGGLSQNLLAVVMLLLLASALATQWIGIHALFGGFVLGAMMPKDSGFVRAIADKIEDFIVVFLLPIYFAYTGLRTEVLLLDRPALWAAAALLIGVAIAGKFGGSTVAARLTGFSWRESAALGALVNTRGLMELIILNIGLDLGFVARPGFAMMVLMAVVTTVMTVPVVTFIGIAEPARMADVASRGELLDAKMRDQRAPQ